MKKQLNVYKMNNKEDEQNILDFVNKYMTGEKTIYVIGNFITIEDLKNEKFLTIQFENTQSMEDILTKVM
jgi:hypothetical protein